MRVSRRVRRACLQNLALAMSQLPAPASAGSATRGSSPSWVAPFPDSASPDAGSDVAPESPVLPVPPAGAPIGGGHFLHPY